MSTSRKPVPPEKRGASSYGPAALLTIRVGKEPHHKDFVAHESFLTCRSEFFRRAVNGRWEEAETRVIKLPEDSPEVFATYLDCAYTNQVPSELLDRPSTASINWHEAVKLSHVDITNLILLYTTADKLLDPFTKDAVIRVFFKVIHYEGADGQKTGPNHPHISLAYENTPEHSPIRRLIVDRALVYRSGWLQTIMAKLPKQFFVDLTIALQSKATGTRGVAKKNSIEAYLEDTVYEQPAVESSSLSHQTES